MSRYEVSKVHGGYFRVYKVGKKIAKPISKDFSSKRDANSWLKKYKKR